MICCIIYILLQVSLIEATETGIFGGRETKPHSRPYMVSIQYQDQHTCGGILIREDFVLTAAHCCKKETWGTYTVVLGAHNVSKKEKNQQHIEVVKYYPHPKFTGKYNYDIMLLKLKRNATLNKYVKTIGLPRKNGKTPANIKCVVAGWGKTGKNMPTSDTLKETTEKMQFSPECKRIWQQYFNSDHMICTKFSKKDGGVCQGDSGGPLICNKKPEGITGFTLADDCTNTKYPHVYTKVNFFIEWIKKTMKQ
ncbi:granzyme B-like [Archocentrus centrarchus]|uniref:granzyme B-like n=1 Tax=Archocentrus centrarchus TaxID=63155 RepID=UPI0011E9BD7D|nr:granzyme B-like [Archocentrus centrarchus]